MKSAFYINTGYLLSIHPFQKMVGCKLKKILVIECDDNMKSRCAKEISAMGHQPVTASCGLDAVSVFQDEKPDLVVIELKLPDINGFEVLRKMLWLAPETPVIIHSSFSHYRSDFKSWAADEYIVKSADMTELRDAINRVLSLRRASLEPSFS